VLEERLLAELDTQKLIRFAGRGARSYRVERWIEKHSYYNFEKLPERYHVK
jgi:hypothetical protein